MTRFISNPAFRATVTISCVLLLPYASSLALAQSLTQIPPQAASQIAPPQLLAPDRLDNLVAPIALYPDEMLGQMLAACTYPLEIVEAQQWLQRNGNLQGQPLIEAARQQNWDPSVEALVAFPDVMALFNRDIRWTTDLGNAFLAQQADVMNAIQRLRAQASSNGRLATTPQQTVTTETQDGQSAIRIQPANPRVIYPPIYDPGRVWGPPASGAYPALSYPQGEDGPGFGSGIDIGGLVSGLLGWGGWGWALNWFTHTLSLNGLFFDAFGSLIGGFNSTSGFSAPAVWAHNPVHRLGVPYANGFLPARYSGGAPGVGRPASDGWRHFGDGNRASAPSSSAVGRGFQPGNRTAESYNRVAAPTYRSGFASNSGGASPQNYRSYANAMPQRMSLAAPRASSQHYSSRTSPSPQRFSAPHVASSRSSPAHLSAPRGSSRSSAAHLSAPRGSSHSSAPRHSGGGRSRKGSHKH